MKKLLVTCRADSSEAGWWDMFLLTRERFQRYAARHGYNYREVWYDSFVAEEWPGLYSGRLPTWPHNPSLTSPCWLKIPAINVALRDYDTVVYFDNDVAILDFDRDISDDLPAEKWVSMPNSTTPEGVGPNIGVVVTRACPESVRFWQAAWDSEAWRSAKWTDNGQVMDLLGYTTAPPLQKVRDTEYTPGHQILGPEWEGFGAGAAPGELLPIWRIFHSAWGRDGCWKLDAMRRAIAAREGERHG